MQEPRDADKKGMLFFTRWMSRQITGPCLGLFLSLFCSALYADNVLHPGTPKLDRPTLTALGVQLPVTGDDNFNATVSLQYKVSGTQTWQTGLPLFRVHPETVAGYIVAPQFSGSIFDLKPATTYDIQLHIVDPDGVDQTLSLSGTTRPVPGDPLTPRQRSVTDSASLQSALSSAVAGDIITLANGTYAGQFTISSSGTANNPIVIRGASQDGVILDGGNCPSCNVFELYGGGYVHLERMTIQNAQRAIRFQQDGAVGNVVRRVHIKNTTLGIGGRSNQNDTYIADNILEGRLLWPHVYSDDSGIHASDDGIAVYGFGDVVAHNRISGYGDAMKTAQDGARANDFYGNDVLFTYDNAIELDGSEGNTRCFRNRFMNTFGAISVQPVHGGPSYILRNVVVNVVSEQLKFHALATAPPQEPSGVLVYHNTFVSPPNLELNLQTPAAAHHFEIENNLFIAPATSGPEAADWTGVIDHGTFDYNGYFPDGVFRFNNPLLGGYFYQPNFVGLQGLGMERNGMIARGTLFANLTAPNLYAIQMSPVDASLAAGSVVLDRGRVLANVNDNYRGNGPDLGALELGCSLPSYGPRPEGTDESNEIVGCSATSTGVTSVAVAPLTVTLNASQTQQFTGTTVPSGSAVTWGINPARGNITSNGLYTAPADARTGETVVVTAGATGGLTASATITLTGPATGGDFTVTTLMYDSPALGETGTFPLLIQSTGYSGLVNFSTPSIVPNVPAPATAFNCSAAPVTLPAGGSVVANVICPIPSGMKAPTPYYDGVQTTYPSYSISIMATGGSNSHSVNGMNLVPRPWKTPGLGTVQTPALSVVPTSIAANTPQIFTLPVTWDLTSSGAAAGVGQIAEFRFQDPAVGPSRAANSCALYLYGISAVSLNADSGQQQSATWAGQPWALTESNSQCSAAFKQSTFAANYSTQTITLGLPLTFAPAWSGKTVHLYSRTWVNPGLGSYTWSGWKDLGVVSIQ